MSALTPNEQLIDGVGNGKPMQTTNEAVNKKFGTYQGLNPNAAVSAAPKPISTVQPLANIKKP